ncbi:MAG: ATP-binding protein [Hyphomicrobiaceae bacterium]|nr:ATP-binding protein [Hyphomicrobiaceae bacterium]
MSGAALEQDRTWRCPVEDRVGDVGRAVGQAEAFARAAGIDEDRRYALQVCIEEALANLVMHATAGPEGKRIGLEIKLSDKAVVVIISDSCTPFDATKVVLPTGPHGAAPGGRGIGLMRAFSKRMRYLSMDGRNHLEFEI